jgi:hypothetical protein
MIGEQKKQIAVECIRMMGKITDGKRVHQNESSEK